MIGGRVEAAPDIIKAITAIPIGAYFFHSSSYIGMLVRRTNTTTAATLARCKIAKTTISAIAPAVTGVGLYGPKQASTSWQQSMQQDWLMVQLAHGAVQLLHATMQFNLESSWAVDDAIRQAMAMRSRQCVQVISTVGKRRCWISGLFNWAVYSSSGPVLCP